MNTPTTTKEAFEILAEAIRNKGFTAILNRPKNEIKVHTDKTMFALTFMPGNRRTLISHSVEVYPEFRGTGLGTEMCKIREQLARKAGVTLLLATVRDDNIAEQRVLEKCEWRRLTQNVTTHCSLWGKELT